MSLRSFYVIARRLAPLGVAWMLFSSAFSWGEEAALNSAESIPAQKPLTLPEAITAYDEGRFAEAQRGFQAALAEHPLDANILHNAGLAAFHNGMPGLALAYWRKALAIEPEAYEARSALLFVSRSVQVDPFFQGSSVLSRFIAPWLTHISLSQALGVTTVALLAAGWLLIGFWAQRRRSLESEQPLPPLPWIGLFLGALALVSITVSTVKMADELSLRATVISDHADALSAPTNSASRLFQVREGTAVEIVRREGKWVQILSPKLGRGWVTSHQIMETSGRRLW